ncbi:MAG: TDT family transporter [Methanobrevibacter sp.]|uniref:TDT family transporter n=1 Tax=Methanobrevibacter sp. TaxID=66852 RepID=UPI003F122E1E
MFIKSIPIPIVCLALSLFSLGNLLDIPYLFAAMGVILLILIILKVLIFPEDIKNDFKSSVLASSSGAFSMSLMLLSTCIIGFVPIVSHSLWIIGIAMHIMLMIYFTYHFIIRNFNINDVYPTYWIVYVGISMAAITAPAHGLKEIGFIFLIIGFISMIITLPLMIYRYLKYPELPEAFKPTTCIFAAVISILIVGYINSAPTISIEFLIGLYAISLMFFMFSLYKLVEYRTLKFYPSFAAFTFPFVISGLATKKYYKNSRFKYIIIFNSDN